MPRRFADDFPLHRGLGGTESMTRTLSRLEKEPGLLPLSALFTSGDFTFDGGRRVGTAIIPTLEWQDGGRGLV